MTRLPLAALAIGAAAVLAGCGSSASGATSYNAPAATAAASSAHVTTLRLKADPNGALRFNTSHLTAKAGVVKLVLTNPSSAGMEHAIAIQGHGSGKVVNPGGTSTLTATLKPGSYTFLCPVPGHAAAGMKGTLTVR